VAEFELANRRCSGRDMERTTDQMSSLPPQSAFFHAILRHLAATPDGDRRENIHAAMPPLLKLSEAQRTERLRNLPHLKYRYRSGWGLSMLKGSGYVDSPARGVWRITDRGGELLASHPEGFGEDVGRRIVRESRKPDGEQTGGEDVSTEPSASATQQPPGERIDAAVKEIQETVAAELLDRIAQALLPYSSRIWSSTCCARWATAPAKTTLSASAGPVTAASTA